MLEVGAAKTAITAFEPGAGMMGYGMSFNFAAGIETELYARAFVFQEGAGGRKLAFVNCEICFISNAIKQAVVERLERDHAELGLCDETVMLCAQHTHSGPGGYSHHALYNLTIGGFIPHVHDTIVFGIVAAIALAASKMRPAAMRHASGDFAPELEVAFNRSLDAYNGNEEVEPLPEGDWHLAVDRTMRLLRFDERGGREIGALSFFGVHTTSLSNDNRLINWDNKGYAAESFERQIRSRADGATPDFVGAFAQATAGDVSPNFVFDDDKGWMRGKFKDDRESARYSGELQCDKALELMHSAREQPEMAARLRAILCYVDFSDVRCDPDLARGEQDARTSPACLGVDMLAGTREGPGMPQPVALLAKAASWTLKRVEQARRTFMQPAKREASLRKFDSQGRKRIAIESGERRMFGTHNISALPIPAAVDPTIATFKKHHQAGALDHSPWTPQKLPLQIFIIGDLALAAIPGELTTIAGRRLRATLLEELRSEGVEEVWLTTYANAYAGYICTYEEYQHQNYEAGHTVFGQWTLAAYRTAFRRLARALSSDDERARLREETPERVSEQELSLRLYDGPFRANARALRDFERE